MKYFFINFLSYISIVVFGPISIGGYFVLPFLFGAVVAIACIACIKAAYQRSEAAASGEGRIAFLYKSIGYVLVYQLICFVGVVLWGERVLSDEAAFVCIALAVLIMLPVYFAVKARSKRPYAYISVSALVFLTAGYGIVSLIELRYTSSVLAGENILWCLSQAPLAAVFLTDLVHAAAVDLIKKRKYKQDDCAQG